MHCVARSGVEHARVGAGTPTMAHSGAHGVTFGLVVAVVAVFLQVGERDGLTVQAGPEPGSLPVPDYRGMVAPGDPPLGQRVPPVGGSDARVKNP